MTKTGARDGGHEMATPPLAAHAATAHGEGPAHEQAAARGPARGWPWLAPAPLADHGA